MLQSIYLFRCFICMFMLKLWILLRSTNKKSSLTRHHSLTHSLTQTFTQLFSNCFFLTILLKTLTHTLTHTLSHTFIHSLTHSLTHSLAHSLMTSTLPQAAYFKESFRLPGTHSDTHSQWRLSGHSRAMERTGFVLQGGGATVLLDAG
jgi:ABC-type glycerol-3-phosphate transport system permease component